METTTKILVVDYDAETAHQLRDWYSGQQVEVLEAANGEAGARLATRETPDIILMDVNMPGINGIEASRRLKADPATRSIPVILLGARRKPHINRDGFDAGIDQYVEKPFDLREMDLRIRSMIVKMKTYQRLMTELTIDVKTGLANYRVFEQELHKEWRRAEQHGMPLSLAMFDLDNFKRLNESVGHPAADRVLREFAMIVARGARDTDLPARYGGEEFAMIMANTDRELATRVAERIRAAVAEFVFLEIDQPLRVTVSVGIATVSPGSDITSAEQLVSAADRALYAAKNAGKNRVSAQGA